MAKKKKSKKPELSKATDDLAYKEQMYALIGEVVKEETGKRFGAARSKRLFEAVVELIFTRALTAGYFRLPQGYGAFRLKTIKLSVPKPMPTRPDLPTPFSVQPGEWLHLRYREGTRVREILGTQEVRERKRPRRSRLVKTPTMQLDEPPT